MSNGSSPPSPGICSGRLNLLPLSKRKTDEPHHLTCTTPHSRCTSRHSNGATPGAIFGGSNQGTAYRYPLIGEAALSALPTTPATFHSGDHRQAIVSPIVEVPTPHCLPPTRDVNDFHSNSLVNCWLCAEPTSGPGTWRGAPHLFFFGLENRKRNPGRWPNELGMCGLTLCNLCGAVLHGLVAETSLESQMELGDVEPRQFRAISALLQQSPRQQRRSASFVHAVHIYLHTLLAVQHAAILEASREATSNSICNATTGSCHAAGSTCPLLSIWEAAPSLQRQASQALADCLEGILEVDGKRTALGKMQACLQASERHLLLEELLFVERQTKQMLRYALGHLLQQPVVKTAAMEGRQGFTQQWDPVRQAEHLLSAGVGGGPSSAPASCGEVGRSALKGLVANAMRVMALERSVQDTALPKEMRVHCGSNEAPSRGLNTSPFPAGATSAQSLAEPRRTSQCFFRSPPGGHRPLDADNILVNYFSGAYEDARREPGRMTTTSVTSLSEEGTSLEERLHREMSRRRAAEEALVATHTRIQSLEHTTYQLSRQVLKGSLLTSCVFHFSRLEQLVQYTTQYMQRYVLRKSMLFVEEVAALQCRTRWAVMQLPWQPPTLPHYRQSRDKVSDQARVEEATDTVRSSAPQTPVMRWSFQASPTDPSSVNCAAAGSIFPGGSHEPNTNSCRLPDTTELGASAEKNS